MSTEHASLQERLETIRDEHRRRHLSDELDDIGETMEETILQRELAKAFFEEEIRLDREAKESVQEMMGLLDRKEYDNVEARLDALESNVNAAETTVENRIQELRLKHNSTVAAMQRLNERVDRVSGMRLEALAGLLDDWRWRQHVYSDDADGMDDLKQNARQYGEEMRSAFEELKDEMFGAYPEEIRNLVYRMIEEERLSYADLTPTQRQQLADSDIGEYIELTLS
jgi:hypothetical protein